MNRLVSELHRLYFPAGLPAAALPADFGHLAEAPPCRLPLLDGAGLARTLVLEFRRARDWPAVAETLRGLVDDLELPLPAVSVVAGGGFRLWLAFAEPLPPAVGQAFFAALRRCHFSDLPADACRLLPAEGSADVELPPGWQAEHERWSAFIDPGLGSVFADEPGLDLPPNPERQAEMLAGLRPIAGAAWQRAMARWQAAPAAEPVAPPLSPANGGLLLGQHFAEPAAFLLAVMNDGAVPIAQRIEAARVLLLAGRRDGE